MSQTLLEKLGYRDEKNILIQGLPSSIEKQFLKLSFAKNLTPLLKSRKIDFALVFALNATQMNGILKEVIPTLHGTTQFWVAAPKSTSKIVTDLHKSCNWQQLCDAGFERSEEVSLDHVWSAHRYIRKVDVASVKTAKKATAAVA